MSIEAKNNTLYILGLLTVGFFLFFIRIYGLSLAPLFDYDSVKNYMLAQQVANLNFSEIFYHASPTLNLFNGLILYVFNSYAILEHFQASLNVVAILYFAVFISKKLNWSYLETFCFVFIAGTSLTMVSTSRYLAMESMSLLLFVVFLHFYLESFQKEKNNLMIAGLVLGLLFTVNYKAFLILPIVVLIEVLLFNKHFIRRSIFGMVCFVVPIVFYMFLSLTIMSAPFKYSAVLYSIMFLPDDHPCREVGFFNTDVFYYIKYLFFYEGAFLIIALVIFPVICYKKIKNFQELKSTEFVLCIIVYCFLIGMSLIQKAPRGLLFVYPLLYAFIVIILKARTKVVMVFVCLFIFSFNIYSVNKYIYAYADTSYRQLAKWLSNHHVKNIATYVGIGSYPYVEKEITNFKVIHREDEIGDLFKSGVGYLLVDGYHRIACIPINLPVEGELVYQAKEKSLLSPILSLEHSEYSGLSFEESLKINESLAADSFHVRLYRINKTKIR